MVIVSKMKVPKDFDLSKEEIESLIKEKKEELSKWEQIGKNSHYIEILTDIALLQIELDHFEAAEKNLLVCLKHFEIQRDRLGIAANYGLFGTLNFKRRKYYDAIENYRKALEIYRELNQVQEIILCLKGIGNSNIRMNKLDEARDIFLECSEISSTHDDIYSFLDCLGSLIRIYEVSQNWDILFELYQKTFEAFEKLSECKGMITALFNLGLIKSKMGDLDSSLYFFKKGTNLAIESNYLELIIKGLGYTGETLLQQKKISDAIDQYIKALHLSLQINSKNSILQIKLILKSVGITDNEINERLTHYKKQFKEKTQIKFD
jgi:tetratricopeptide (TPR) repeat protein